MGVTPRIVQNNTVITMHGTGFVESSDNLRCRFICIDTMSAQEIEEGVVKCEVEKLRIQIDLTTYSKATYLSSSFIECQSPDAISHNSWYSVVASIDGGNSYGTIASSSSTSESKTSRTSKGNGKDGDEVEEAVNEESKTLVTIPLARALQAIETIFPSKPDYMLAWAKKELHPDLQVNPVEMKMVLP